jgi:hypothetical protein
MEAILGVLKGGVRRSGLGLSPDGPETCVAMDVVEAGLADRTRSMRFGGAPLTLNRTPKPRIGQSIVASPLNLRQHPFDAGKPDWATFSYHWRPLRVRSLLQLLH